MSSIVTNILSSTLGLLWNKVGHSTTEELQREGDVTDAKTREFLARELLNIKTKFDDFSSKDLLSSYTFLQQGVDVLNAALHESNLKQKALSETQDDDGETSTMSTVGSDVLLVNELQRLSHAVRKIKLNSDKEFESAKERFKDARNKATEALSIDTLGVEDKILATKLRIVSEILECLDNPEGAIPGCLSVLKKLQSLSTIQEIFHEYILNKKLESLDEKCVENVKSVMLINFVLFEYVVKFSSKNPALCWPTIELNDRSFNPILDWMLISERKCMGKDLDQHPGRFYIGGEIQPYNVAMNSHCEIVFPTSCETIKIVSRTGERKTIELPNPKELENVTDYWIEGLTIDMNNKVYVLRRTITQTGLGEAKSCSLCVFNENYSVTHECALDFLKVTEDDESCKMAVDKNNDIIICQGNDPFVYICNNMGQLKHKIETESFEGRPIFCIGGKNEIVVSRDCSQEVEIYTEEGNLKLMINVPDDHSVLSVAFHYVMCKIIVLTRDYDDSHHLCLYSESGELETTAMVRNDFGWCPAVISHPSGPFAVVTSYHFRFIY